MCKISSITEVIVNPHNSVDETFPECTQTHLPPLSLLLLLPCPSRFPAPPVHLPSQKAAPLLSLHFLQRVAAPAILYLASPLLGKGQQLLKHY